MTNRLEVLQSYIKAAIEEDIPENDLYIDDLIASVELEIKFPTKNYTQECYGVIVQGKVKQDFMK